MGVTKTYQLHFLVLIIIALAGCHIPASVGGGGVAGLPPKPPKEGEVVEPKDTIPEVNPNIFRETYKVSVLLPFSIDRYFIDEYDFASHSTPYRSLIATEIYRGMKMAIEDLEDSVGISLNLDVYDTKNDSFEVKFLLNKFEVKKSDLVIGPLFTNNLKIATKFAVKNRTTVISPVANRINEIGFNSYLLYANPTNKSHVSAIATYIKRNYRKNPVYIIRSLTDEDLSLATVFKNNYLSGGKNVYASSRINEIIYSMDDPFDVTVLEELEDTAIIFIPSNNELVINEITRDLNTRLKNPRVILFGMPDWLNKLSSVRLDYLSRLNFHFSSAFHNDPKDEKNASISQRYRSQFSFPPSEYVYRGYYLMQFAALGLRTYGKNFTDQLKKDPKFLYTEYFTPRPVYGGVLGHRKTSINYFENSFVHIMRYKNYEIQRVK